MDCHVDLITEAGHGLVYAVIDYLIDEVVEATVVSAANVHAGP
ncbi:hypothetical protein ES703_79084 [subsurface metagenome]